MKSVLHRAWTHATTTGTFISSKRLPRAPAETTRTPLSTFGPPTPPSTTSPRPSSTISTATRSSSRSHLPGSWRNGQPIPGSSGRSSSPVQSLRPLLSSNQSSHLARQRFVRPGGLVANNISGPSNASPEIPHNSTLSFPSHSTSAPIPVPLPPLVPTGAGFGMFNLHRFPPGADPNMANPGISDANTLQFSPTGSCVQGLNPGNFSVSASQDASSIDDMIMRFDTGWSGETGANVVSTRGSMPGPGA